MRRRLFFLFAVFLVAVPTIPAARAAAPDPTRPFVRDLWHSSAHDPQKTWDTCTIATMRIARSLASGVDGRADAAAEREIYDALRAIRTSSRPIEPRGLDAHQWAIGMTRYGPGAPYVVQTFRSPGAALRAIVTPLVRYGLAVGVEVAAGKHAWLVVGVRTDRDPRLDPTGFRVTAVRVVGPLNPLRTWRPGYDPAPGTWLSRATFLARFTPNTTVDDPRYRGRWVIVAPAGPRPGEAASRFERPL